MKTNLLKILLLFIPLSASAQSWRDYTDSATHYRYTLKNDAKAALFLDSAITVVRETMLIDTVFANYCSKLGDYLVRWNIGLEPAIKLKRKAIEVYKLADSSKSSPYLKKVMNVTTFFINYGVFNEGIRYANEASNYSSRMFGDTSMQYSNACFNEGICYMELNEYQKAEEALLKSLQITQDKNPADLPDLQMELGLLYMKLYQFNKSESFLLAALQSMESDSSKQAYIHLNIGSMYTLAGDVVKALIHTKKAYGLAKPDSPFSHTVGNNLGIAYLDNNMPDSAKKYMLRSYKTFKKLKDIDPVSYADICENLASVYFELKNFSEAEKLLRESITIYETHLGKGSYNTLSTYTSLGKICFLTRRSEMAKKYFSIAKLINRKQQETLFAFQSEEEKKQFIEYNQDLDDAICTVLQKERDAGGLLSISSDNKSLLLNSSRKLWNLVHSSGDSVQVRILSDLRATKEKLSSAYATPINEREEDIQVLENEANELEKKLIKNVKAAGSILHPKSTDILSIQKTLAKGDAFIDFYYYSDFTRDYKTFYFATIVLPEGPVKMIPLFEEDKLERLFQPGKADKKNDRGAFTRSTYASNGKVYELVWKPLEKYLNGSTNIFYSPCGLLHKISFSALPSDTNTFISDRYKLTQLTAANALSQATFTLTKKDTLHLYGGITYSKTFSSPAGGKDTMNKDQLFSYLEGTLQEVRAIKEKAEKNDFVVKTFTGSEASEEKIKVLGNTSFPSVLHIATHGFFFPGRTSKKQDSAAVGGNIFETSSNPFLNSGLLFAGANDNWKKKYSIDKEDGILTSFEVSNLYLPKTHLVVLSACESGLGNIEGTEGVYGLQRAFKIAGAEYIIMSLWKVPDGPTAVFMEHLYDNLLDSKTIGESFAATLSAMKSKYRKDVYNWGAWVLLK